MVNSNYQAPYMMSFNSQNRLMKYYLHVRAEKTEFTCSSLTACKGPTWNSNPGNQTPLPVGFTFVPNCLKGSRAPEFEMRL